MATTFYVTKVKTGTLATLATLATTAATATHLARTTIPKTAKWFWASLGVHIHGTDATEGVFGTGYGALFLPSTLTGLSLKGAVSLTIRAKSSASAPLTVTTLRLRVGVKNITTGVFTQVGTDVTKTSFSVTTSFATYTVSGTLSTTHTIAATERLYIELWMDGHCTGTDLYISVGSTYCPFTASTLTTVVPATGKLSATASLKGKATVSGTNPPGPTMPRMAIEIALTGTIWTGANWVTIAPFVRTMGITRGRQNELQRAEAGTLELALTNQDGRFNAWSKNTPYYNQLPPTDSNPTNGAGTLTFTNTTGPRSTTQARFGLWSWALTATASPMTAETDSTTACVPGRTYQAMAFVRAKTTARSCSVGIVWKNTGGSVLSTTTGTAVTDSSTGWTMLLASGVAPATAVKKDVVVTVTSPVASEVHYLACLKISDVTHVQGLAAVTPGWCVGQGSPLTPAQPIRVTATWGGLVYPVFAGAVATWEPKYGRVLATQVVKAYDYMHVLGVMPAIGSSYAALCRTDGAVAQWRLGTAAGTASAEDSTGNGHTGTVSGYVTFGAVGGVAGTPDTALRIGGPLTSGGGDVTASVSQTASASIEFVISPGGDGSKQVCVSWGSGASRLAVLLGASTAEERRLVIGAGTTTHTVTYTTGGTKLGKLAATTTPVAPWHLITLVRNAGTVTLHVDGKYYGSTTTGASTGTAVQIGPCIGFVQDVSLYQTALTTAEIAAHYQAFATRFAPAPSGTQITQILQACGVPASAIGTIDPGQVECICPLITTGQTQALSVIQMAENTEQGFFSCNESGLITYATVLYVTTSPTTQTPNCVIADDNTPSHLHPIAGSVVPSQDDITLWNFVPVGIQGASSTATSGVFYGQTAASQARYGMRSLTGYTSMYFKTPSAAQALADKLATRYAKPQTRVRSVGLDSTATTGKNLSQMLGRRLLDAVELRWQPIDGSDTLFVQVSQIEQITHVVTPFKWTTTYQLYPFAVNA